MLVDHSCHCFLCKQRLKRLILFEGSATAGAGKAEKSRRGYRRLLGVGGQQSDVQDEPKCSPARHLTERSTNKSGEAFFT
jgi:hypothetical protein